MRTIAGAFGDEAIGKRVLGIGSIAGWEKHLVLDSYEDTKRGVLLMFRWDNDPSPQNTQRGRFAIGVTVDPEHEVDIEDAPTWETLTDPSRGAVGMAGDGGL